MPAAKPPRGEAIRLDHGHAKITTVTAHRWTPLDEEAFLDSLAASANVSWSARQNNFSKEAVYKRRRLDAAFAARWQAALEQGYARVEMALVRAAADSMEGVAFDADRPIPKMTVDQAHNILKLHAANVGRAGRRYGSPPRRASLDDVRGSIARKVDAVRRAHGLPPAE